MADTYVLSYDVLLDYPEIIANPISKFPQEPKFNEEDKLLIPEICIEILAQVRDSAKDNYLRGRAIEALKAIKNLPGEGQVQILKQTYPVLVTEYKSYYNHFIVDELAAPSRNPADKSRVLLTNRAEILERAKLREVKVSTFYQEDPPEFTGIRYYVMPDNLYDQFAIEGRICDDEFFTYFPDEEDFVRNEYVVMIPEGEAADVYGPRRLRADDPSVLQIKMSVDEYVHYLARYSKKDKALLPLGHINHRLHKLPKNNPEYACYIDALCDPDISLVIVTGPAGSGKTYAATRHGLQACRARQYREILIVQEGRPVIGAVRGGVEEKMAPMSENIRDAIRDIEIETEAYQEAKSRDLKIGKFEADLDGYDFYAQAEESLVERNGKHHGKKSRHGSSKSYPGDENYAGSKDFNAPSARKCTPKRRSEVLDEGVEVQWRNYFKSVPYEYAQGRTFCDAFVIYDEMQRLTLGVDDIETLISRPGKDSKNVFIGDPVQMRNADKLRHEVCGITYARKIFQGTPEVAQIQLNMRILRGCIAGSAVKNREAVRRELRIY